MKTARPLLVLSLLAMTSRFAIAHPGHDDGHELSWDFENLAAHPFTTGPALVVVFLAAWIAWKISRRAADGARPGNSGT